MSEARMLGAADRDVTSRPTVIRMVLGKRLRALREARGITLEQAGAAIRASHSKISRLELGRVGFRERDLSNLLTLYGIGDTGELHALMALARRANGSGWWQHDAEWLPRWFDTYLTLENTAQLIRCYEPRMVPELLQTPDYARAVFRLAHPGESQKAIERRVALQIRRQNILIRSEPPMLWAMVEEAALRRPIGGPHVWGAQLDHLERAAQEPHITVQIVRDHVGGPALVTGPFAILRFASTELSDVVYLQHLTSALYLDKPADLDAYREAADRLSVLAAPPDHTSQVLAATRAQYPPTFDRPY